MNFKILCSGLILGLGVLAFTACNEEEKNATTSSEKKVVPGLNIWTVPVKGTTVAQLSKHLGDKAANLNNERFEVKVIVNEGTATTGKFDIELTYGAVPFDRVSKDFPKWYENNVVMPIVKAKEGVKYGALIGFDPGDGTFKELYEVIVSEQGDLNLERTKFYSIKMQAQ